MDDVDRDEWAIPAAPPSSARREPSITDARFTLTYRDAGREITVDLDEVPDEKLPARVRRWRPAKKYAVIEDIRFMADHGETLAGVAERLSVLRGKPLSGEAVERFLHLYGAHEVVWQLKAAESGDPAPTSPDWYLNGRISRSTHSGGSAAGRVSSAAPRTPLALLYHNHTVRGRRL